MGKETVASLSEKFDKLTELVGQVAQATQAQTAQPAEQAKQTAQKVTTLPDPVLVRNTDGKPEWQVERDAQYKGQIMFRDVNADGAPFTKDDGSPKRYKRLPVGLVRQILAEPDRFAHLVAE